MSDSAKRPLSYTQNLEDFHLSLAFAGRRTGFYIDVGAGHPVADNVSFWFYERGWRGLVAEPQPDLIGLYSKLRPRDVAFPGLVGAVSGTRPFHQVERLHGFSTMVEANAEAAGAFGADYETSMREASTLADLCRANGVGEIDFLTIDVEGAEGEVLAGNDWSAFRPKIIVVEAVSPGRGEPAWQEWEPLLLANGYRFRLFDTLNRFYVAEECPDLFERLPAERAPWDSATHMYEIGRAPEHARHPDHALAGQLADGFWAGLPNLDPALLVEILRRGRGLGPDEAIRRAIAAEVGTEAFRAALGRIACGYDGGQIIEKTTEL